jgi:hypothetical protein
LTSGAKPPSHHRAAEKSHYRKVDIRECNRGGTPELFSTHTCIE